MPDIVLDLGQDFGHKFFLRCKDIRSPPMGFLTTTSIDRALAECNSGLGMYRTSDLVST
jgi:hypothetical protein